MNQEEEPKADACNVNVCMFVPKGLLKKMCVSPSRTSQGFLIMKADI